MDDHRRPAQRAAEKPRAQGLPLHERSRQFEPVEDLHRLHGPRPQEVSMPLEETGTDSPRCSMSVMPRAKK